MFDTDGSPLFGRSFVGGQSIGLGLEAVARASRAKHRAEGESSTEAAQAYRGSDPYFHRPKHSRAAVHRRLPTSGRTESDCHNESGEAFKADCEMAWD
jgi:hypothetical protein